MIGLLALLVCAFAVVSYGSLAFFDQPLRQQFVGAVSMASLISMFASPLAVMVRLPTKQRHNLGLNIKLVLPCFSHATIHLVLQGVVIRTECVEFMPFYLSLSTLLMSASFAVYGFLLRDFFIYVSTRSVDPHFNLHLNQCVCVNACTDKFHICELSVA